MLILTSHLNAKLKIVFEQSLKACGIFDTNLHSLWMIVLSSFGIYSAVIIYTRIFGKRSFSKMSSSDFAMTVALGSITATIILEENLKAVRITEADLRSKLREANVT